MSSTPVGMLGHLKGTQNPTAEFFECLLQQLHVFHSLFIGPMHGRRRRALSLRLSDDTQGHNIYQYIHYTSPGCDLSVASAK